MTTCDNGKDPLCSCTLPNDVSDTYAYAGPPDGGVDGGAPDGGPWTCERECAAYHPNGNGTLTSCTYDNPSPAHVICNYYVRCVGRGGEGVAPPDLHSTEPAALFLAMAELEASSVAAFERLAVELAHHGAPGRLIARARRAARDEVRHACSMHALAERFGAVAALPDARIAASAPRPLADVLRENAVEGCVRETFGAAMAHAQALLATDPVVRAVLAGIADDEARHAALAWDIDSWGREKLRGAGPALDAARREAVDSLFAEIAHGAHSTIRIDVGLVGRDGAFALASAVDAHLWWSIGRPGADGIRKSQRKRPLEA